MLNSLSTLSTILRGNHVTDEGLGVVNNSGRL